MFWHIWVEDSENEHIYHSETWALTAKMAREAEHRLAFTIPIFEPLPSQYYIRCVCAPGLLCLTQASLQMGAWQPLAAALAALPYASRWLAIAREIALLTVLHRVRPSHHTRVSEVGSSRLGTRECPAWHPAAAIPAALCGGLCIVVVGCADPLPSLECIRSQPRDALRDVRAFCRSCAMLTQVCWHSPTARNFTGQGLQQSSSDASSPSLTANPQLRTSTL